MAVVFFSGFESGDFSEWAPSTTGTEININSFGAITGSYDCEIDAGCFSGCDNLATNNNEFDVTDESAWRFGFSINLGTLSIPNGESFPQLFRLNDSVGGFRLIVGLINDGGTYRIEATDFYSNMISSSSIGAGDHNVEVLVTSTGIELFLDGQSQGTTSHTNDDSFDEAENITVDCSQDLGSTGSGSFFVDNITVESTDTQIFPSTVEFYVVDIDNDNGKLYLTGLDNGTLSFFEFDLDTLTLQDSDTFGSATVTNIQDKDYGLYLRVLLDNLVYLYGNDGNDNQVYYNDLSGWQNISPNTLTTEMVTGFIINSFDVNELLLFTNTDDIYESVDGGSNWDKINDASEPVFLVGYHPINYGELLYEGESDGALFYTHNKGQDSEDLTIDETFEIGESVAIVASGDDGFRYTGPGGFDNTDNEVSIGEAAFASFGGFLRYIDLPINEGETIVEAYLTFKASVDRANPGCDVIFYADDQISSPQITDNTDYDNRTRTTNSVSWSPTAWDQDEFYQSPDLTDVVQEIVDLAGFDGTIQFLIDDNSSTQNRAFYSQDSGDTAATLNVAWLTVAGDIRKIEISL